MLVAVMLVVVVTAQRQTYQAHIAASMADIRGIMWPASAS